MKINITPHTHCIFMGATKFIKCQFITYTYNVDQVLYYLGTNKQVPFHYELSYHFYTLKSHLFGFFVSIN